MITIGVSCEPNLDMKFLNNRITFKLPKRKILFKNLWHNGISQKQQSNDAVFKLNITIRQIVNKAYRPNAHLLDTLMHYNINII